MSIASRCVAMLSITLWFDGNAIAQSRPPLMARPVGIRIGPTLVKPTLELANVGIDTNILREAEDPKADQVGTVGSHVDLFTKIRPLKILLSNTVSFDYFKRYAGQQSVNRQHQLYVEANSNDVTLFASGEVVSTRERLNYEIDQRVRRIASAASAGSEFRVTAKTTIAGEVQHAAMRFENALDGLTIQRELDRHVDRASGDVRWSVTRRATLAFRGEAGRTRFDSAPVRDSHFIRLTPSIDLKPRRRIAGRVAVGYLSVQPLNNDFPEFGGIVGSIESTFPLTVSTQLKFDLHRDLDYSYQKINPTYVLTAIRGSIVQRVGNRWEFETAVGQHKLAYRSLSGAGQPDVVIAPRVDRGLLYYADVRYRLARDLRVGINADYVHRFSDIALRQVEGFRAGGSIQLGFDR